MKTKSEILEILRHAPVRWCAESVKKAISLIENFPDSENLADIAQKIPQEWVYLWALDIGDREIVREHIKDSRFAYLWALKIGDREIMRERVTDSYYAYLWARDIGEHELMRNA